MDLWYFLWEMVFGNQDVGTWIYFEKNFKHFKDYFPVTVITKYWPIFAMLYDTSLSQSYTQ